MPQYAKKQAQRGRQTNLWLHPASVRAILDLAETRDWSISRAAEWLIIRGMRAEARGQSMRRMRERRAQMGERIPMDESDGAQSPAPRHTGTPDSGANMNGT